MLMDSLRCTGRTTRMLQFAIERAVAGESVNIVSRKEDNSRRLYQLCYKLAGDHCYDNGTKPEMRLFFPSGKHIRFSSANSGGGFEWRDMQFRGERGRTLVDHDVIEAEFSNIIAALHQFDDPKAIAIIDQMKALHKTAEVAPADDDGDRITVVETHSGRSVSILKSEVSFIAPYGLAQNGTRIGVGSVTIDTDVNYSDMHKRLFPVGKHQGNDFLIWKD